MKKKVIIVGGGFGGISACQKLSNCKDIEVLLIDRRNHHLFQPLLYQVAMAGLNPSDISIPIRKLFTKSKNVKIEMAEVKSVDCANQKVYFDNRSESYDYLVLACGAKHSYFGNKEWEKYAPGLKNIEQATEIRRRVLTAFELAEKTKDEAQRQAYLTFAIIGGGPTGVELAGSLAEMAFRTLKTDYKIANLENTKIILIEAGNRVLPTFPKKLSKQAEKDLKDLGVEIKFGARANDLNAEGLKVGEEKIFCKTIIWAAGVTPAKISETIDAERHKDGRIIVKKDLSLKKYPNVYVIGDQAYVLDKKQGSLPGIAPVAIQQGNYVGKSLIAKIKKQTYPDFEYFDKGIMATIGRTRAVVSAFGFHFSGIFAWLTWVIIHIFYLMRFKNRLFVLMHWAWSYFNFGRGARLIVHKSWRFYDGKNIDYEPED